MRLCAFVPMNLPINYGFILAPPTIGNTIFWQWINQSYNACMNYGNRNASSPQTNTDILMAYTAAVTSSIGIGLFLRKTFKKYTTGFTGAKMFAVNSMTSYFAVCTAGFLNSYCMRRPEMKIGIDVVDEEGKSHGKSQIAAKKAVLQTSFSRLLLPLPVFTLSPLFIYGVERAGIMPKNKNAAIAVQLACITCSLMLAVPASVAIFPQYSTINAGDLEPQYQQLTTSKGEKITEFFYNKGL